jgi:hypothetical protein
MRIQSGDPNKENGQDSQYKRVIKEMNHYARSDPRMEAYRQARDKQP